MDALREHGRGAPRDIRSGLASDLVVAQVALSLVLVVAAGLFGHTFVSLAIVHLGFDFSKGASTTRPRRPGRNAWAAYGRHGQRPVPSVIDDTYEVPAPLTCPECGASSTTRTSPCSIERSCALVDLDKPLIFGIPPASRGRVVHFQSTNRALPIEDDFADMPVKSKVGRVGFGDGPEGEGRPEVLHVLATAII